MPQSLTNDPLTSAGLLDDPEAVAALQAGGLLSTPGPVTEADLPVPPPVVSRDEQLRAAREAAIQGQPIGPEAMSRLMPPELSPEKKAQIKELYGTAVSRFGGDKANEMLRKALGPAFEQVRAAAELGPPGQAAGVIKGLAKAGEGMLSGDLLEAGSGFATMAVEGVSPALAKLGLLTKMGAATVAGAAIPAARLSQKPTKFSGGVAAPGTETSRISSRRSTIKSPVEDAEADNLQIDLPTMKRNQVAFRHNMAITKKYPGIRKTPGGRADDHAEGVKSQVKDNLRWLYNKVPEAVRSRSRLWYDGANKMSNEWATEFGMPPASVAGVMAALSPQMDWFKNVSLARRTMEMLRDADQLVNTPELRQRLMNQFPDIRPTGKPLKVAELDARNQVMAASRMSDLKTPLEKAMFMKMYDELYVSSQYRSVLPEGGFGDLIRKQNGDPAKVGWSNTLNIAKAVKAFESGGNMKTISSSIGDNHKVRSFFNNIFDPNNGAGDVTIDTHAVAAALLRPFSGKASEVHHNFGTSVKTMKDKAKNDGPSGQNGLYGLYADAYRELAAELGVKPRELQSITWEAVRGLYPDNWKSPAALKQVDAIWDLVSKNKLSEEAARDAIENIAKSIGGRKGQWFEPSWFTERSGNRVPGSS